MSILWLYAEHFISLYFLFFFSLACAWKRCAQAARSSLRLQCPLVGTARRTRAPPPAWARDAGAEGPRRRFWGTCLRGSSCPRWQTPVLIYTDRALRTTKTGGWRAISHQRLPTGILQNAVPCRSRKATFRAICYCQFRLFSTYKKTVKKPDSFNCFHLRNCIIAREKKPNTWIIASMSVRGKKSFINCSFGSRLTDSALLN